MNIGIPYKSENVATFETFLLVSGVSHLSVNREWQGGLDGSMMSVVVKTVLHAYNSNRFPREYFTIQFTYRLIDSLLKTLPSLTKVGDPSSQGLNINTAHYRPTVDFYSISTLREVFYDCQVQIISTIVAEGCNRQLVIFNKEDLDSNSNEIRFLAYNDELENSLEDYINYDQEDGNGTEIGDIEEDFDLPSNNLQRHTVNDSDWRRDYFDAMTDGQLGNYEDFEGGPDDLDIWSGR